MKKIEFDKAVLRGMADVRIDEDPSSPNQGDEKKDEPDPKYVLISLTEQNDPYEKERIESSKSVANPTIYKIHNHIPSDQINRAELYTRQVVNRILNHFQKYGAIQEIRFVGHGSPGEMNKGAFQIGWLLDELSHFEQKEGKIVNRIVFEGCNTFSGLNEYAIKYYSNYSQENHTQLVGTTSETVGVVNIWGNKFSVGRFVQFSPNGKIIRDKLDTRFNLNMLSLDNDRSWTDFYINHTAEEGAAIKKAYEEQRMDGLRSKDWFSIGR